MACITMPKNDSIHFGVVEVNKQNMVTGFQEKPEKPKTIPGSPDEIFGSMGIYLFNTDMLKKELAADASKTDSDHDFGKNIIPQMVAKKLKVYAYDFSPGKMIRHPIGGTSGPVTLVLLGEHGPLRAAKVLNSICMTRHGLCARTITIIRRLGVYKRRVRHRAPLLDLPGRAGGCVLESGHIEHSVVSNNVVIKDGVLVKNSVIMDSVTIGKGAQIQGAIIDKDVDIAPAGAQNWL